MRLQLQYPVKVVHFNQKFGENATGMYKAQNMPGHNGIDFMAPHGTPVYAAHDGMASYQVDTGGGHGVVLVTNEEFDYEGRTVLFKTIYWHLCDSSKEPKYRSPIEGKTGFVPIKCGDLIGYADNTGQSTGDHLHFGLKPVARGENWGAYYNIAQENGYFGAIDPMPYFIQETQPVVLATWYQKFLDIIKRDNLIEWNDVLKKWVYKQNK